MTSTGSASPQTVLLFSSDPALTFFVTHALAEVPARVVYATPGEPLPSDSDISHNSIILIDLNAPAAHLASLSAALARIDPPRPSTLIGLRTGGGHDPALDEIGLCLSGCIAWPCADEFLRAALGLADGRGARVLTPAEKAELLSRACSCVSHTINNPLTAIIGQAQLARLRPPTDAARFDKTLATIEREAHRIRHFLARFDQVRRVARDGILPTSTLDELLDQLTNGSEPSCFAP